MQLTVNGESRSFDHELESVDALLAALEMPRERVAVEVNGTIIRKAERDSHALTDGDVIEIVTLVGGG